MNIQPIVEGYGEVAAVPALLRRLRDQAQAYGVEIGKPIRQGRNQLVTETGIRRAIELARLQASCGAVLVLLDGDDDCPAQLGPQLQTWAQAAARDVPCRVVIAHREYEAWFLAALVSLQGVRGIRPDAAGDDDPEKSRDAKAALEKHMAAGGVYSETSDQAALTSRIDLRAAYQASRSFRKLIKAFGALVQGMGQPLASWPPPNW